MEFLSDGDIFQRVRDLISSAKKQMTIVSPYLQVPPDHVRQLESAIERGVIVSLMLREDCFSEYLSEPWFASLRALKLSMTVVERLHAKLYFNEQHAILTSMNYSRSSADNSREA